MEKCHVSYFKREIVYFDPYSLECFIWIVFFECIFLLNSGGQNGGDEKLKMHFLV